MSAERVPTFLLPENPTLQKDKIRREKNQKKQKTGVLSKNQRRTAREWWRGTKYLIKVRNRCDKQVHILHECYLDNFCFSPGAILPSRVLAHAVGRFTPYINIFGRLKRSTPTVFPALLRRFFVFLARLMYFKKEYFREIFYGKYLWGIFRREYSRQGGRRYRFSFLISVGLSYLGSECHESSRETAGRVGPCCDGWRMCGFHRGEDSDLDRPSFAAFDTEGKAVPIDENWRMVYETSRILGEKVSFRSGRHPALAWKRT